MKPGAWLIVAGGWNVQQFKENRRPTQAELVAAAPEQSGLRPARVRLGDADAARAQGARHHERRPICRPGGRFERDATGNLTGAITGRTAGDRRAVRQAAAADLRRAGRGHEGVLPRAQSSRHHRA